METDITFLTLAEVMAIHQNQIDMPEASRPKPVARSQSPEASCPKPVAYLASTMFLKLSVS